MSDTSSKNGDPASATSSESPSATPTAAPAPPPLHCHHQQPRQRRKLRPLVITTPNSTRQKQIAELLAHFELPDFTPSVPSRSIRSRLALLTRANEAGLLPQHEWDAIQSWLNNKKRSLEKQQEEGLEEVDLEQLFDCFKDVPVLPGRKGNRNDVKLHYAVELWRKAKGLNRNRAVLACTLAHLIAMKRFCCSDKEHQQQEGEERKYDFILEDNVRAPIGGLGGGVGTITTTAAAASDEETNAKRVVEQEDCKDETDCDSSTSKELSISPLHAYCECAERIWGTIEASQAWEEEQQRRRRRRQLSDTTGNDVVDETDKCHLRYYGWLGSIPNLEWVIHKHSKNATYKLSNMNVNDDDDKDCQSNFDMQCSVFPFPMTQDFDSYAFQNRTSNDNNDDADGGIIPSITENDVKGNGNHEETIERRISTPAAAMVPPTNEAESSSSTPSSSSHNRPNSPGGTPLWGAFAYWISSSGYNALLTSLRNDVGALLWKGKRMRCYVAKPIDKIMPRQILTAYGRDVIHVTTCPAFFRAPMLTSSIHQQWDVEFCRSTEYQMSQCGARKLTWDDLWLTKDEREIVRYRQNSFHGVWLTLRQLAEMKHKEVEKKKEGKVKDGAQKHVLTVW